MHSASINRFEWLKAVLQAEGLTPTAKNVASALAVQFANDETGQLNPSQETLANYLKVHRDSIKRVLRELRNAGWLIATGDGGRGKAPLLRLLTPGKILSFRATVEGTSNPAKGGANRPPQEKKRGGNMCEKGGQIIPPQYKDKQSLEQRERVKTDRSFTPCSPSLKQFIDHRFVGAAFEGLRHVPLSDWDSTNQWSEWLASEGLPKLCHLPIGRKAENGQETYFSLPGKTPPICEAGQAEARHFFISLIDGEARRYAAQ